MDFYQLEYVLAVAKYKNFTKASEEMNVSQSSLSQQIAKLEDELGVRLFERTTRTVHILPAGAEFIEHAQRIINECRHAKHTIEEYKDVERGSLVIGGFPIISHYNMIGLIADFTRAYPKINFEYKEADYFELVEMLHTFEINAAFLHMRREDPNLAYHHLMQDEVVIIVNNKHPLAQKEVVHLSEAKDENFILSPANSLIFFDTVESCRIAGFEPKIVFNCSSISSMMGFVHENLGITLLSHRVALDQLIPGISIVKITPSVTRTLAITLRKDGHVMPAARAFISFARQWVADRGLQNSV